MAMHFGDMLLERRRSMGLSIQQVANAIKIRPQIIEFIETENLASMPPRGYAQGMISSYARYLGLNPRMVVDAYFDALNAYEHGTGQSGRRYQEYAPDASPRSSNATGRFMMVGPAPSASRYAQRPPQAGYVSEDASMHEPMTANQLRPLPRARRTGVPRGSDVPDPAYNSAQVTGRLPVQRDLTVPNMATSARGRARQGTGRYGNAAPSRAGRNTGQLIGRSTYRGGAMPPARDAARRQNGGQPPRRTGGNRQVAPSGFASADSRLVIALIAAVLIIIVLLGFLLLRGCAPSPSSTDTGSSAPKVEKTGDTSDGGDIADDGTSDQAEPSGNAGGTSDEGGEADPKAAAEQEPKETKVKVSIKEEGAVAFLEVKLDGKSVLGAQEVGPFEQEFTVTQQIEITTDKPSDVTVTKNGERVRYDLKVSGVAKVTITAPQPKPEENQDATDGQDQGDGTDQTQGTDQSAQ